jgi:pimeloyl-ACP methyl ester carboxylesterase
MLALWGERDGSHRETRKESSLELGTDVRLTMLPNVGHLPEVESPITVAREIQKFLAVS